MQSNPMPGAIPSPFMDKVVPSPFMPYQPNKDILDKSNKFLKEVEELGKKYGFEQIFLACGKNRPDNTADWFAQSNALSDGMMACIRDSLRNMQRFIDDEKRKGGEEPTPV